MPMEYWSDGVLEYWVRENVILEEWNDGKKENVFQGL